MSSQQAYINGFVKRAAEYGFSENDAVEMLKSARLTSEFASVLNPLNLISAPFGALAAAVTPTRSDEEQDEAHSEGWENMLLPGRGVYNLFKRQGNATKGEIKPHVAEALSNLNPLNSMGGTPLGALAALLTKGRSEEDQLKADDEMAQKILMPGRSQYDTWKRLGMSNRKFDERAKNSKTV